MTNKTALAEAISAENKLKEVAGLRLNIASLSDIHFNHPNTPTEFIIRNINRYVFPDTPETRALDIIFIGGDVTDSLMDFASDNAVAYRKWVSEFLRYCAKHDIMVRIIEGTPLHDWGQSIIFVEENENHEIGCDLKYFTDISIEHIERYNIDVLYIPDEARPNTLMTWAVVQQLMAECRLTKVDFAIMHGAFGYQLPNIEDIKDKIHDEEKYCDIVRHYIFIGHVHQHRPNGKIIPNGSTDRLRHGEEDIKGHVRLNKGEISFIPNLGAMRYITLEVPGMAADEIMDLVEQRLKGNDDQFQIRLLANTGDVAFGIIKRLTSMYPHGRFDVANIEKATKKRDKITMRETKASNLPALTRANLLEEWKKEILKLSPERFDQCSNLAEVVINAIK